MINRILKFLLLKLLLLFKGRTYLARYLGVKIGSDCRIYITDWGTEPFLISIGNRVTITGGVKILTHDGSTCLIQDENKRRYQKFARVVIGNDVFIGVNSIILPGVEIGDSCIVAAGSVVTGNIEKGCVVAGVPAKKIMSFTDYKRKVEKGYIKDSDLDYTVNYKERVLKAVNENE